MSDQSLFGGPQIDAAARVLSGYGPNMAAVPVTDEATRDATAILAAAVAALDSERLIERVADAVLECEAKEGYFNDELIARSVLEALRLRRER